MSSHARHPRNWKSDGACRSVKDPDIFYDIDQRAHNAPPTVMILCSRCDVRETCLNVALENKEKHGIWGGMTPWQREQLHRARHRVQCPGCESREIIQDEHDNELCISCGLSWSL